MAKPVLLEDLLDALVAARGCDCCADTNKLQAIVPCQNCIEDDDDPGYLLHTYDHGCTNSFRDALTEAFAKVRRGEVR